MLSLDAPSRAQVGENVGVVVTVRNDGNSPGSYTDALVVADGPVSFEVTFTVHDIAPGEVREVVVGTTIDAVGDVLLGLEKTGVTTRVVVGGGFPGRRALPETED